MRKRETNSIVQVQGFTVYKWKWCIAHLEACMSDYRMAASSIPAHFILPWIITMMILNQIIVSGYNGPYFSWD